MSSLKFYRELVENLNNRIAELQGENDVLHQELSRCNGKIEVLSLFYSDFKYQCDDKFNSPPELLSEKDENQPKPHYDILLNQYFVNQDTTLVETLLRDYEEERKKILTSIRNQFPSNMLELVKKYNCVEDYEIVLKSLDNINDIKEKKSFTEKGIVELVDKYIRNYNKGKRNLAINAVRQALIYYPLLFDDTFLSKIRNYWYDDLENVIRDMRVEYYGRKTVSVKTDRKPRTVKSTPKPTNDSIKQKRTKKLVDYKTDSIDDIVKSIIILKNNKSQEAVRRYKLLIESGRSDDEVLEFLEKIDGYCIKNKMKPISDRI